MEDIEFNDFELLIRHAYKSVTDTGLPVKGYGTGNIFGFELSTGQKVFVDLSSNDFEKRNTATKIFHTCRAQGITALELINKQLMPLI